MRELLGLLAFNVALAGVGASLLWCVKGWRHVSDLVRLGGLAYLVGLAALIVSMSTALAVGLPFGRPLMLLCGTGLTLTGVSVGWLRGLSRPPLTPDGWSSPRPPRLIFPFAAAFLVYFAFLLRSLRLTPLFETDAWWVWTIRAKALYFAGDLGGASLVGGDATGYPAYPPGLSLIHAAAFEAMGSADTVTLHVQHWFLAVGFVAALLGLLSGRVRPVITCCVVLLMLGMPGFAMRVGWAMADCLLGYLVGTAGVLVYLWLEDRSQWRLLTSSVLLGGAMLVKREGAIAVGCVMVAALVASTVERRKTWPQLLLMGSVALALTAPWRLNLIASGVKDEPTEGYLAFLEHPDRALPALELVLRTFIDVTWLGFGVLAVAAILIAFASGPRKFPLFATALLGVSLAASAFVIWSETTFEISAQPSLNPIVRMTLVTVLMFAPLIPLLLESGWRAATLESRRGR